VLQLNYELQLRRGDDKMLRLAFALLLVPMFAIVGCAPTREVTPKSALPMENSYNNGNGGA
jgi:hypothetical protein